MNVCTTGHNGTVWSAAFDAEGQLMATACDDGSIHLWQWHDGVDGMLCSTMMSSSRAFIMSCSPTAFIMPSQQPPRQWPTCLIHMPHASSACLINGHNLHRQAPLDARRSPAWTARTVAVCSACHGAPDWTWWRAAPRTTLCRCMRLTGARRHCNMLVERRGRMQWTSTA